MLLKREVKKMKKEINVKLILDYKKKNKLTIKTFCEQCNICMDTYYCIIKGKRFNIKSLFGIARTMNVTMTQLFNA